MCDKAKSDCFGIKTGAYLKVKFWALVYFYYAFMESV